MWSSRGSSTVIPSLTPPREPGRFTTKVWPACPATPRLITAVGVFRSPALHSACMIPGDSRSSTRAVDSGVTSSEFSPVPPVVITNRGAAGPDADVRLRSSSRTSGPSGITRSVTSRPRPRNQSRSSGPQRSSAVPDAAELDTTTTTALRPSR